MWLNTGLLFWKLLIIIDLRILRIAEQLRSCFQNIVDEKRKTFNDSQNSISYFLCHIVKWCTCFAFSALCIILEIDFFSKSPWITWIVSDTLDMEFLRAAFSIHCYWPQQEPPLTVILFAHLYDSLPSTGSLCRGAVVQKRGREGHSPLTL